MLSATHLTLGPFVKRDGSVPHSRVHEAKVLGGTGNTVRLRPWLGVVVETEPIGRTLVTGQFGGYSTCPCAGMCGVETVATRVAMSTISLSLGEPILPARVCGVCA